MSLDELTEPDRKAAAGTDVLGAVITMRVGDFPAAAILVDPSLDWDAVHRPVAQRPLPNGPYDACRVDHAVDLFEAHLMTGMRYLGRRGYARVR